jgi:hypothetical protein
MRVVDGAEQLGVELLEPPAGDHRDIGDVREVDEQVDDRRVHPALGGGERVVEVEDGQCVGHEGPFWRTRDRALVSGV